MNLLFIGIIFLVGFCTYKLEFDVTHEYYKVKIVFTNGQIETRNIRLKTYSDGSHTSLSYLIDGCIWINGKLCGVRSARIIN